MTADVGGHLAAQGDEPERFTLTIFENPRNGLDVRRALRRPTATATKPRREMMTRFDDDDDREVLRDGERLRVSITRRTPCGGARWT